MKADLNDLKKLTMELIKHGDATKVQKDHEGLFKKFMVITITPPRFLSPPTKN